LGSSKNEEEEDNCKEDDQLIWKDLGSRRGDPCGHSDERFY